MAIKLDPWRGLPASRKDSLVNLNLRHLTAFAALLGSLALSSTAQAQLHFNFTFDPSLGNTGGTGTLDLASDPGNGAFLYGTLAPTYSFSVNGTTFTEADYVSNPTLSELVISDLGGGVRGLAFSNTGGNGGGPQGGSVDLNHLGNIMSFSPSGYPGTAYFENSGTVANYSAISGAAETPEPGSLGLLVGMGSVCSITVLRRKKARKSA